MYVNDPIADMLTRIRNANMIYSESVDIPSSKMKLALARILKDEGYIKNFRMITDPNKPYASHTERTRSASFRDSGESASPAEESMSEATSCL